MIKQIIIEIDQEGNCNLEGHGFIEVECDKALSEIENAIGQSTKRIKKREYVMKQINKLKEKNA